AVGELIGNCGPSGGLFQTWICDTVGYAGQYLTEGSYISAATNPVNDLVSIAYDEEDTYYGFTNMKIVQQLYAIYLPMIRK
ncbi:MAG TPA: hypothetical protein PKM21_17895, partial [Anaerolineales bacterium]|nr:hypothetical protein [Anaerolineales bacterium]